MASAEVQIERMQRRQLARFRQMGLSVKVMPNGSCLLVALPLGPAPMESLSGPMAPDRVIFSTVGVDRIKCLRPRALFTLPLIDIRSCADSASVEWTIRQAWRDLTRELRDADEQLRELGLKVETVEQGSALAFPLPGEPPDAQVLMRRLGEAILPSAGALSGLSLKDFGERVFDVSDCLDSDTNLERRLRQRLDELREKCQQREADAGVIDQRKQPVKPESKSLPRQSLSRHGRRILIVGPELIDNSPLREELRRQGYRTAISHSESDALKLLAGMSPDLVISQFALGRSDGASLVQAMRDLTGVDRLPVVLLDDSVNEGRREAAKAVGAAGYVITPREMKPFVARLTKLVNSPPHRRYKRYNRRLTVQFQGASQPALLSELSRGGVFVSTQHPIEANTAMACEVVLPEIGKSLGFDGQVVYFKNVRGDVRHGLGLRFFDISSEDEATLIEYLNWLESGI